MATENGTIHDAKSETKVTRPKYIHSLKERSLVETLLEVDDENELEEYVSVITWDLFDSISGWEDASPNVKYNLPKRRRPTVHQTQDGQSFSYNQGKPNWPGSSQYQNRSYELDFVDSPAWKICVEPTTYRYIPNNGRYRASKLVKKLEIQKCVRKTCSEKLSPEQRQLQKEIQRELRREFETYLRLEKQKNSIQKLQQHERVSEAQEKEETDDEITSVSYSNKEMRETIETPELCDVSDPGSAKSNTSSQAKESCSVNTASKHCNSKKPAASLSGSKRSPKQSADNKNHEQKRPVNSQNLELPPINIPLLKINNDQHRKRHHNVPLQENSQQASNSMMFQKTKFVLQGYLMETDPEQERDGPSSKNMRSVSEPPPQHPIPSSDMALRLDLRPSPGQDIAQNQSQTHRKKFECVENSIGYTQSLCDVRQPIPSIPTRIETLTKDVIEIKPITHGPDKLGQIANGDQGNGGIRLWQNSSTCVGESSTNNNIDVPNSVSSYDRKTSTSAQHNATNTSSASIIPTRGEAKSAQESSISHFNKGLLENGILATRFTATKVKTQKSTFLSMDKKKDLRKPGSRKALKPPFEPQVEDMAPSAISVAQAFHSVPINKMQSRNKKTQEQTPQGLLPEISGQRIPVSLTSQRII